MKAKPSKLDAYAEQLTEWFGAEKLTLAAAREKLAALGCSVSLQRLSCWWQARQQQALQDRVLSQIATGSRFCADVDRQFTKHPAPELETIIRLVKVLIMRLSVQGETDPELLETLSRLLKPVMDYAKLCFEQDKFRESLRTNIERALQALFEDIKGRPELLAAYERFKSTVMASVNQP